MGGGKPKVAETQDDSAAEGESSTPAASGGSLTSGLRYNAKPAQGISLPEAAGLPVDETFTFLSVIKRYILHGAQLGMPAGGAGAAGASFGASIRDNGSIRSDGGGRRMSVMGEGGPKTVPG